MLEIRAHEDHVRCIDQFADRREILEWVVNQVENAIGLNGPPVTRDQERELRGRRIRALPEWGEPVCKAPCRSFLRDVQHAVSIFADGACARRRRPSCPV